METFNPTPQGTEHQIKDWAGVGRLLQSLKGWLFYIGPAQVFSWEGPNDTVLGLVEYAFDTVGRLHLTAIAVLPERRREGIGSKLVEMVENMSNGDVILWTSAVNETAHHFFRRLGYTPQGTIAGFYPNEEDGIMWRKRWKKQ